MLCFSRFSSFGFLFINVIILGSCSEGPAQETQSVVHLTPKDEPGRPFILEIQILDVTNKKPVAGVEVFAYHTNWKGNYENDAQGIARIHGTAVSDASGELKFITIYPRGYNDSPTGEHIHFRIKGGSVVAGNAELVFSEYYARRYDYEHPSANDCHLKSLEEKDGSLYGKAILYVKRK